LICFIANFLQILKRHAKLTNTNLHLPLSVYRDSEGRICNITSADVETCIRNAASKLFNLDPITHRPELQMWSSHSLRVGHAPHFMQWASMKWKSNICYNGSQTHS
jgi:hypothetical protein